MAGAADSHVAYLVSAHRDCPGFLIPQLVGPNVEAFATRLFEGPLPWAKLRAGLKLVSLGERYGSAQLDAACARAHLIDVRRLQCILLRALDAEDRPVAEVTEPLGSRFARPAGAFDHRQQRLAEAAV